MGRIGGANIQAVGIRCRREWTGTDAGTQQEGACGDTGRMAHADGQVKVLVDRQEVWEQWTGHGR